MPITSTTTDPDGATLTLTGDYPVTAGRLWSAWADPRSIERFWGPPGWPATFTRHDLAVGGSSEYVMYGPDGERSAGFWRVEAIDDGHRIEVIDGFALAEGVPNPEMPTMRMVLTVDPTDEGSRFTLVTTFPDRSAMEQLLEMGMAEGIAGAFGQLDDVLADADPTAAGRPTEVQLLDATTVRITRVIRGTRPRVWDAHQEPATVRRWLLGPDGWTMPVCEVADSVGDPYRYEWESEDGSARFGFEGELVEQIPGHRSVQTERMVGTDGPSTRNEMTLTSVQEGTLLSLVVRYPTEELRDQILATGMVGGMETSYARLDRLLSEG